MRVPVDGHVHFHDAARVDCTLDAAATNFRWFAGEAHTCLGVLLLAEAGRERVFDAIRGPCEVGDWHLDPVTNEPESSIARRGKDAIAVVCGRQVRAADGLEVLALGTRDEFPDGLSLEATVRAVCGSAALPVIPWGFGKQIGARGRRVEKLLTAEGSKRLFIGDNGSRLDMLGQPSLVRSAQRAGFRVLPGTDPFPMAGDHVRVGSFGFLADLRLDERSPWACLREWLFGLAESPPAYGRGCSPARFLKLQMGIQVRNRLRREHRP